MASEFSMKRRDNLPILRATLWEDSDQSTAVDLTNADTVTIKVGKSNQSLILNRDVDIVEPTTSGKVETQITAVESDVNPDKYHLEFEVAWLNGDISTYPKEGFLVFTVNADLDPVA